MTNPLHDLPKPTHCRVCRAETMLHQDPDSPDDCRRIVCGVCAGKANRIIVDRRNGR